jgi:hypothetical protein
MVARKQFLIRKTHGIDHQIDTMGKVLNEVVIKQKNPHVSSGWLLIHLDVNQEAAEYNACLDILRIPDAVLDYAISPAREHWRFSRYNMFSVHQRLPPASLSRPMPAKSASQTSW